MKQVIYPKLTAEMASRGITRKDLAEVLGIGCTTMTNKMSNRSEFTLSEIQRIKKALGVDMPLDELFASNEKPA